MKSILPLLTVVILFAAAAQHGQPAAEAEADALPITGTADPKLASFDRMMTAFVQRHKIPGAALAVAKDGRLVYARGFGYADVERRQRVEAHSLMRVASVSKPITAVAILLLAQQGKLKLTDRAWDILKSLEPRDAHAELDPRWKNVTILELLQHTGGWDRKKSFDPMFRPLVIAKELEVPPPASARDVVRYMMEKPLDFEPGQQYAYSNFGYCVLGRVIEAVSGQTYEQFVQRDVLARLGIRDMRIGKTLAAQQAPGEVTYYDPKNRSGRAVVGPQLGKQVPLPYGTWYHEALDAHGGWIGSAPDLVRFAASLDRPGPPDVLNGRSLEALFERPKGRAGFKDNGKPRDTYYACGWEVRPVGQGRANTWHAGFLPGSESLLVRRSDGLTWAVLFNTSGVGKATLTDAIAPLIHQAADEVKSWPRN